MEQSGIDQPVEGDGVECVVKWFNSTKGFGFVRPVGTDRDAFLHISVVQKSGIQSLPEGAPCTCVLGEGPRGLQVSALVSIEAQDENSEEANTAPIDGRVKFYNVNKGFGFIIPEDGSQDVFVSVRTLRRHGLEALDSDTRVRVTVHSGHKGPVADTIELLQ